MTARRVAILAVNPWQSVEPSFHPFSFGAYRVAAAVLGDERTAGVDVRVIDGRGFDEKRWLEELASFDPDVVGASCYVWSLPIFAVVLEQFRKLRPDAWIVLGGPSARPEMLALPPFRALSQVVDAVVLDFNDAVFPELVRLWPERKLSSIAGIGVPDGESYRRTHRAPPMPRAFAPHSPFQMGLAPEGLTAHLQTFEGCPMHCSFCAWGDAERTVSVSPVEFLEAELAAFRRANCSSVMSVDAGLNLSARAFENLMEAESRVGFLSKVPFHTEVYPSAATPQMLEFLRGVAYAEIGLGLQSYDPAVTELSRRKFQVPRFERLVSDLAEFAHVKVELILGLPGDDLATFERTLERVLALPVSVQVFFCLVLPDAMLKHAPADWELRFDPISLQMLSCKGWSAEELSRARRLLDERSASHGGLVTTQWPRPRDELSEPAQLGRIPAAPMWYFPNHVQRRVTAESPAG
ncbi:MAG: radical SAM protein [Myxococcales bacterium]|nr:radical SAM protein [Myxococcales bacterium]MCB9583438.1 radical SAM protein [Polyangiaceae bacterium]